VPLGKRHANIRTQWQAKKAELEAKEKDQRDRATAITNIQNY